MKFLFRVLSYISIIVIFVIFNIILLNSLREEKAVEGKIKPKIVLISHVYSNPYWQYIKQGAEKAARERNAVVEFQGPDSASVEEGIKFINMAYAAKASGIITYVQDEEKYKPVIDRVVEGDIPVVTIDSDAEKSKRLAYIGTDNIKAGGVAAEELINQVGKEGNIGIIVGGNTVKNQMERVQGFKNYISENSELSIATVESSDSYLLEAEIAAKKILLGNRDIKAIFCASALDGVGAAKALTKLGLAGKVKIICFDDLPETINGIRNGVITSTIVQMPNLMGYNAVNIIMNIVEGKDTKGVFSTDVYVVKKENLEEYEKEKGEYGGEAK
ncbi:substrate-binding domain-containing protein [Clostridium swellfunianum]|uniref:substrate-binding domain-containing protein n=1 Tax=Clostridium swellfunianum TaxID=1367462 RepID=UPI00202FCFB4|nr:substrate-binding domain-containing protein [Clostridium swellfunianum]